VAELERVDVSELVAVVVMDVVAVVFRVVEPDEVPVDVAELVWLAVTVDDTVLVADADKLVVTVDEPVVLTDAVCVEVPVLV
jgi:hypothetical protein